MTEQPRILDFQIIERASEKYANLREVIVHIELEEKIESFIVEIYKHFSPLQIKDCVAELVEKLDYVRPHTKNDTSNIMVPYMIFLIIKHFTTLVLPDSFPEQLKAIEHMTNTGTMFQIFMSMDEEEIARVQDEVSFVVDNLNLNVAKTEEYKNLIREKLVDKSLLD
ncbi:hypothetical protein BSK59_15470 [Paenibacillus odorifer]|uniref:hypothetical protein n=1 Tax=Paenibacillus odorifer TaxID=189426 RepID=UPI00096DB6C2|nr:hypothetical protein [Paenibacillus odorifer]OME53979.1 hypothetical protein BSK59_15470 [Paenibacillus odorifer]